MELSKIKLDKLKPASYNPRKISESSYKKLQNSIEKFGVVDPIVINTKTKTILAGHQRFDVLYHNSPESEVNILQLGDISWVFPDSELKIEDENHEKALNIALNHISGEWDISLLTPLLDELSEVNLGELTGFDLELEDVDYDLVEIANSKFNNDDDFDDDIEVIEESVVDDELLEEDIIEIDEEENNDDSEVKTSVSSKTKRFVNYGDVYRINNNIIMCGDSEDESDVQELLNHMIEQTKINDRKGLVLINEELDETLKIPINFYMTLNPKILEDIIKDYNNTYEVIKL